MRKIVDRILRGSIFVGWFLLLAFGFGAGFLYTIETVFEITVLWSITNIILVGTWIECVVLPIFAIRMDTKKMRETMNVLFKVILHPDQGAGEVKMEVRQDGKEERR